MEKRKCVICNDEFSPKFQRRDSSGNLQNIWYYNYYCSQGCFEDGEKMLFDSLLSLKESGLEIPLSWITKENQQLRESYDNINWCGFLRLQQPQLKQIQSPSIYTREEELDDFEVEGHNEEEIDNQPKGFLDLINNEKNKKPGRGQIACSRCKSICGVKTKICPSCGNDPRS